MHPHTIALVSTLLTTTATAHSHNLLPKSPHHHLQPRQSDISICLNDTGDCALSNTIGDQCLSIIGLDQASLEANDTPQNAQKVRDCICNGDYWKRLYACNSCLTANNLYPTDLNPDATPLPTLSSSYCSPSGGRSAIETIDGFADPVTQLVSGYDVSASTTGGAQATSTQQITGGGAGRVTPSPDATGTGTVLPYLNHSANTAAVATGQTSNSGTATSSSAGSSASTTSLPAGSTTASPSQTISSASATSPSVAAATTSSGFRSTASFPLASIILFFALLTLLL